MKIKIINKPDKNFYDEIIYIQSNYKRILKNPNLKIKKMSDIFIYIILICLVMIGFCIYSFLSNNNNYDIFIIGALSCLVLYSVFCLFSIQKRIKTILKERTKCTININDSGIETIKENSHVKLKWNDIAFILVNNYSICCIPKKEINSIIAINREYKDEFLKGIKKYKKEELIIKNI